jgi:signal transduction histidine kinase
MWIIMLTSGAVVLLTCGAFFSYELLTYKARAFQGLETLGEVLASNSTASLAFDNERDATEVLSALRARSGIVGAALYDRDGKLFARFPVTRPVREFRSSPEVDGFRTHGSNLAVYMPVVEGDNNRLGTLYLESDRQAIFDRLWRYAGLALLVMLVSLLVAYLLSAALQGQISRPILAMAQTARAIAIRGDYSVRATKIGRDEIGLLTDAFNQMLGQIEEHNTERGRAEERLRQLLGELERSNKELELFAYIASHDLQEPLRMVSSYTQLLERRYSDKLDDDAREFIGYAVDGANRMQRLINDLLDFSRLSTRGRPLVPTDIAEVLGIVRANLSLALEEAGALVTNDELPWVVADAGQMGQLFQNLIGNAIKFRNGARPHVHVGAVESPTHWQFSVHDDGIGIEPEYFERIFVIFQRLHTKDEYSGTGIGLALCRRIVERHGGTIWVESKLHEGSTFYFTIPKRENSKTS